MLLLTGGPRVTDPVVGAGGRVAALYVAERMRNEVVATVAAHYQHLQLVAARRAATRAARHHAAQVPATSS